MRSALWGSSLVLICALGHPCFAQEDVAELASEAEALYQDLAFERAVEVARKAVEAEPQDAQLHALLGRCLLGARRNPEAIRSLNTAVRLDPEAARAHADLGYAKALGGNPKAGLLNCARAIELEPQVGSHYGRRGLAQVAARQFEQGLHDLTRALELDPNHELRAWRGFCLIRLNRNEEAIAEFDLAIKQKPAWGEPYGYRGEALYNLGRIHQAVADWDQALARLPTNHPLAEVLRDWKARVRPTTQPENGESSVMSKSAQQGFLVGFLAVLAAVGVGKFLAPPVPLKPKRSARRRDPDEEVQD